MPVYLSERDITDVDKPSKLRSSRAVFPAPIAFSLSSVHRTVNVLLGQGLAGARPRLRALKPERTGTTPVDTFQESQPPTVLEYSTVKHLKAISFTIDFQHLGPGT